MRGCCLLGAAPSLCCWALCIHHHAAAKTYVRLLPVNISLQQRPEPHTSCALCAVCVSMQKIVPSLPG